MKKHQLLILVILISFFYRSHGQIIQAPILECVHDSTSNGDIILQWSNPSAPANPCGNFIQYTIYGSSSGPGGPYDSVVSITNSVANTITLVNYSSQKTWYFYMETSYGCPPGATVLQSDTVNNNNPSTPQIVNVTVTNGQAIFNWLPSTSPQTTYYEVYLVLTTGPTPIATLHGRLSTTYVDLAHNPNTQSLTYTVAAIDSCGQISAYNTAPQNSIYMTAGVTECQRQININWNRYINWPQGVQRYQIWVSRNDSAFQMNGSTDSSTRTYSYTDFNDGDSLCFVVRAVSAADTSVISNSNEVCMKAIIVQPPAFNYITNVTVDAFNHIIVTWNIDSMGQLIAYKINQSTDGMNFISLAEYNTPSPIQPFSSYDDSTAYPQNSPYYYSVIAYDSCENTYPSDTGVSISLQGQLYDYFIISLNWNEFQLFGAKVLYYNLYRNYGSGFQLDQVLPDSTVQAIDSVQQFLAQLGTFCYKIEAVYSLNLPNGYHAIDSSWSNKVCVIHRPVIYIPNAFSPDGGVPQNMVFKPTIIFGNPQAYSLIIYNRWGGEVFESSDLSVGWDGNDHGKAATEGGYAYYMQFTAEDGVVVKQEGIVLLVR